MKSGNAFYLIPHLSPSLLSVSHITTVVSNLGISVLKGGLKSFLRLLEISVTNFLTVSTFVKTFQKIRLKCLFFFPTPGQISIKLNKIFPLTLAISAF